MALLRCLAVGVGNYKVKSFRTLITAEHDAQVVAGLVGDSAAPGQVVDTRILASPTKAAFMSGLRWLYSGRSPARCVLYLSGHAYRSPSSRVFFACRNSKLSDIESAIAGETLAEAASRAPYGSEHLWVFDCCYAGGLAIAALQESGQGLENIIALVSGTSASLASAKHPHAQNSNTFSSTLSPFTRAIVLGLRGLGHVGREQSRDASDLIELAAVESVRLGLPSPLLLRRGSGAGVKLSVRTPPRSIMSFPSIQQYRRAAVPRRTVVIGTDGVRSLSLAMSKVGKNTVGIADGRSDMRLGMSLRLLQQGYPNVRLVIEAVRHVETLEEVLGSADEDSIPVLDPTLAVPEDRDLDVLRTPNVTASEAVTWLRRFSRFENFGRAERDDQVLEAALARSRDSIELTGLFVAAVTSDDNFGGVVEPLEDYPGRSIVNVLSAAQGVFLPINSLATFLASHGSEPPQAITKRVLELRDAFLIDVVGPWCRVMDPIAAVLPLRDAEEALTLFTTYATTVTPRSRSIERFQILTATSACVEAAVAADQLQDEIVELLCTIGEPLTAIGDPRRLERLLGDVILARNSDVPSALLSQHGNVLRLLDRYEAAEQAYVRAGRVATSADDRFRSEVGRVSAMKNATDKRAVLQELRHDIESSRGAAPRRGLANSLFQQANIVFSSSSWNEAEQLYRSALALLDDDDPDDIAILAGIWKGLGDIMLRRNDVPAASILASRLLDVCGEGSFSYLDAKTHAKTMQYVGDVERMAVVTDASASGPHLSAARYWLERSLIVYENAALRLGALMSQFKLAQCLALASLPGAAHSLHVELAAELRNLNNQLWRYRACVMASLEISWVENSEASLDDSSRQYVSSRVTDGTLSPYHQAWGHVALAVARGGDVQPAAESLIAVGAERLGSRLLTDGAGTWLAAFY